MARLRLVAWTVVILVVVGAAGLWIRPLRNIAYAASIRTEVLVLRTPPSSELDWYLPDVLIQEGSPNATHQFHGGMAIKPSSVIKFRRVGGTEFVAEVSGEDSVPVQLPGSATTLGTGRIAVVLPSPGEYVKREGRLVLPFKAESVTFPGPQGLGGPGPVPMVLSGSVQMLLKSLVPWVWRGRFDAGRVEISMGEGLEVVGSGTISGLITLDEGTGFQVVFTAQSTEAAMSDYLASAPPLKPTTMVRVARDPSLRALFGLVTVLLAMGELIGLWEGLRRGRRDKV